ncbi:MAG: YwiC-like family protein [Chloroflexi bacterium]|nr:YwiC-like family protein [Chloroflexota bacterium]
MKKGSVVPKEHGAWAMLLIPLAIGWGVAGKLDLEALLFLVTTVLFFIGRYPLGQLANRNASKPISSALQRRLVIWSTVFVGIAVLSGLVLLFPYRRWSLLLLGAICVLFLLLQFLLQRRRADRTAWGELLAIAGLSMTGPGAYYSLVGTFDNTAFALWILPFLYSGSSVFYVKMKVRQRLSKNRATERREKWRIGQASALYLVSLLVVAVGLALSGAIPPLAAVAFLPLTYKMVTGIFKIQPDLTIRRIGFTELGHSLLFAALLVLIFHFSPHLSVA